MKLLNIIFLFLLQNHIFCQRELVKENKFVILKENNQNKDTLHISPGLLIDYKLINNQAIFILDVAGMIMYKNMIFDGLGWIPQKTSGIIANNPIISSVPRTKIVNKTYKIEGIDKIAIYEDGAFKEYYDFDLFLKRKKARADHMDSLWNARQLLQNNKKKD